MKNPAMNTKKIILASLVFCIIPAGIVKAAITFSNIEVNAVRDTSVNIQWDTDIAATGQVEYGSAGYGSFSEEKGLSYWQQIEVTGLTGGRIYHYRIRAKDYKGNETVSEDYSFTTRTAAELEAIIIAAREAQGAPADLLLPQAYYVKTDGDDGDNGKSPGDAWQSPAVAVSRAYAGDTIYLMDDPDNPSDGVWDNEVCKFANSGIETHPITLTAYNGTPTLNGVNQSIPFAIDIRYGPSYINISGITIKSYDKGGLIREADNIHISNCEIYNMYGSGIHFVDITNSSLSDCDIHDIGWNSVMVETVRNQVYNMSIINNEIYDNPGTSGGPGHNLIDIFNFGPNYSLKDINIIGNELYNSDSADAIFEHGEYVMTMYRINISNNIIHNTTAMRVSYLRNSIVYNNTIYDQKKYGIQSCTPVDSTMFVENTIYNNTYADIHLNVVPTGKVTFERNNITYYRIHNGAGTLIDEGRQSYDVHARDNGTVNVEYSDGTVFKREVVSGSGSPGNVKWYPSKSNLTVVGNSDLRVTITTYPMSVIPAAGYTTITVNKFDLSLPPGGILVDITVGEDASAAAGRVDFVLKELKSNSYYNIFKDDQLFASRATGAGREIKFFHYVTAQCRFTISETDALVTGRISGRVTNRRGLPIEGAGISNGEHDVFADNNGCYALEILPIGEYELTASASGYLSSRKIIILTEQGITVDFTLATTPGKGKAVVYPNPYISGQSAPGLVYFDALEENSCIRIYTLNGDLITTLKNKGAARKEWNISGVAGGIYLYYIDSPESKKRGKISIIK